MKQHFKSPILRSFLFLCIFIFVASALYSGYLFLSTPQTQIAGVVFFDANGNGIQDSNERGYSQTEIVLSGKNGKPIQITTVLNGKFLLKNIALGNYTVTLANSSSTPQTVDITDPQKELLIAIGTSSDSSFQIAQVDSLGCGVEGQTHRDSNEEGNYHCAGYESSAAGPVYADRKAYGNLVQSCPKGCNEINGRIDCFINDEKVPGADYYDREGFDFACNGNAVYTVITQTQIVETCSERCVDEWDQKGNIVYCSKGCPSSGSGSCGGVTCNANQTCRTVEGVYVCINNSTVSLPCDGKCNSNQRCETREGIEVCINNSSNVSTCGGQVCTTTQRCVQLDNGGYACINNQPCNSFNCDGTCQTYGDGNSYCIPNGGGSGNGTPPPVQNTPPPVQNLCQAGFTLAQNNKAICCPNGYPIHQAGPEYGGLGQCLQESPGNNNQDTSQGAACGQNSDGSQNYCPPNNLCNKVISGDQTFYQCVPVVIDENLDEDSNDQSCGNSTCSEDRYCRRDIPGFEFCALNDESTASGEQCGGRTCDGELEVCFSYDSCDPQAMANATDASRTYCVGKGAGQGSPCCGNEAGDCGNGLQCMPNTNPYSSDAFGICCPAGTINQDGQCIQEAGSSQNPNPDQSPNQDVVNNCGNQNCTESQACFNYPYTTIPPVCVEQFSLPDGSYCSDDIQCRTNLCQNNSCISQNSGDNWWDDLVGGEDDTPVVDDPPQEETFNEACSDGALPYFDGACDGNPCQCTDGNECNPASGAPADFETDYCTGGSDPNQF